MVVACLTCTSFVDSSMNPRARITACATPRSPRRSLPNGYVRCAPQSSRGWRLDLPIDGQRSRHASELPDSNRLPDVRSAPRDLRRGTEIKNTCPGDLRRGTEIKNTCRRDLCRGTEIKNTCRGDLRRGTEIKNTCRGDLRRGTEIKSTCTWVYRQFDTVVLCFRHGLRHSRSTGSSRYPP